MQDTKPWYQSRAVIASVLTVIASIGGIFGFSIPTDLVAQLTDNLILVVTAVTGLVSLVGRIVATKKLS